MLSITVLALGMFAAVWTVHYLLQTVIAFSIEMEEGDLKAAPNPKKLDHLKSISILRSLEFILTTVFMAILPITGILIGAILPDPIRTFLSGAIGEKAVITVTVMALFAYYAIFQAWKQHQGTRVRAAIMRLLRSPPLP